LAPPADAGPVQRNKKARDVPATGLWQAVG
jgi:hypothetical protein